MKALVAYDPGDYRYEDRPVPVPRDGEVLIKVKGCGICAGDLKVYNGMPAVWGTGKNDRLLETPITPGHEFCGEVVATGENVSSCAIGDFVVAEQIVPCGECRDCIRGAFWMCSKLQVFGLKRAVQGGFAEYTLLPRNSRIHKVPKSFTVEQAAIIEPYACGMHAAEQAAVRHSDVVVIGGMGTIGLAITNIVRLSLPKMIIGIDVNPHRLSLAKKFGADVTLDPTRDDVSGEIKRYTDSNGCDVYIEASGYGDSIGQGLSALKNHGKYVQFGMLGDHVNTNWNTIGDGKELTVIGSHLSALCYPAVIKGIESGLLRTDGLISHSFRLENWKEAFETPKKDPSAMKIMLTTAT